MRSHALRAAAGGAPAVIDFVGSFYSASSDSTSRVVTFGSSLTGGIDTTPRTNDLVLVITAASDSGDVNLGATGYTEVADLYANGAGSGDTNLGVFYKVMGGSPDTSVTITQSPSAFAECLVYVLRGADPSTPIDVTTTTATGTGTSSAPNPPSITPASTGAAVVAIGAATGTGSVTSLTSAISDFVSVGGGFAKIGAGVAQYGWTSGAVDPAAFGGGTNDLAWAAATLAIRPA